MSTRALVLFISGVVASSALPSQAGNPDYENAIAKARAAVEEVRTDDARRWISVALATYETRKDRAEAFDLLGSVEGIEAKYWTAFRHFFAAARLGSPTLVTSVDHPQAGTKQMARCAVRLVKAGLQLGEAQSQIKAENGLVDDGDLDDALRPAIFGGTFVCPQIDVPPEAPVAATPPVTPAAVPDLPESNSMKETPASGTVARPVVSATEPQPGFLPEPPLPTWILGGVALAAVGTGGVLTALAYDEATTLSPVTVDEEIDSVDGMMTAAGIAYSTAGAAAIGAIVFWLLDAGAKDPVAEVDLAPGAFSVRF